jgi:hypothetical protein
LGGQKDTQTFGMGVGLQRSKIICLLNKNFLFIKIFPLPLGTEKLLGHHFDNRKCGLNPKISANSNCFLFMLQIVLAIGVVNINAL